MLDLTVVILTKNEENNLEKCINSFGDIVKRFVVVDSGSTDNTVNIAKKMGADVFYHEWKDYATQMNWGLNNTNITTAWTMRIDADEELTKELVEEIKIKLPKLGEDITGVYLRRRMYFMGKWIRHGGIYPTLMLRLFRTNKCICEQAIMDEHMILTQGEAVSFDKDFFDKNTKSLEWWIGKHNWYSDREVLDHQRKTEQEKTDEVEPKFWGTQVERKRWLKDMLYYKTPLMRRAHWYFIYRYFIRLGFLDGKEGLIYHFLQGYWYRFLVDAKIYERERKL